ncbi:hypothetical protein NSTC745_06406 [Nostoc sp. DSM 114161]|jgi:hypothetical protein|uniref:hypothetical protein n=1 Tax=Nostoc sp. DSM 114161 TaxID=3440143 RepID=UPI004045BC1C
MSHLTEALEIALLEQRHDCVCSITAQFVESFKHQGFGFDELVDGLMNYAWANTDSADAVYFLCQAALALKDDKTDG